MNLAMLFSRWRRPRPFTYAETFDPYTRFPAEEGACDRPNSYIVGTCAACGASGDEQDVRGYCVECSESIPPRKCVWCHISELFHPTNPMRA